jgi:hypothetical protein
LLTTTGCDASCHEPVPPVCGARDELERHLDKEEQALFPACRYDQTKPLYRTRRRLLAALSALEVDLHQHAHEENNVLFPSIRATVANAIGGLGRATDGVRATRPPPGSKIIRSGARPARWRLVGVSRNMSPTRQF